MFPKAMIPIRVGKNESCGWFLRHAAPFEVKISSTGRACSLMQAAYDEEPALNSFGGLISRMLHLLSHPEKARRVLAAPPLLLGPAPEPIGQLPSAPEGAPEVRNPEEPLGVTPPSLDAANAGQGAGKNRNAIGESAVNGLIRT